VPKNALIVLYADPAGLDLDFNTLRFFAERYKHLDLLLSFPVPGVDRALSAMQAKKASKVLNHAEPIKLLASPNARTSIREWFERQLGALGYDQFCTQQIRLHANSSPLYDLMLVSRTHGRRRCSRRPCATLRAGRSRSSEMDAAVKGSG
jgi:hypothetical protein